MMPTKQDLINAKIKDVELLMDMLYRIKSSDLDYIKWHINDIKKADDDKALLNAHVKKLMIEDEWLEFLEELNAWCT